MSFFNTERNKRLLAGLLAVLTFCAILVMPAGKVHAEQMRAEDYKVVLNDNEKAEKQTLGAYTNGYDNRLYFSLRDLAVILNGTEKQFNFEFDEEDYTFNITTGAKYVEPEPVMVPKEVPELNEGDYFDREGNLRDEDDNIIWTEDDEEEAERPDYEYLDLYINPLYINGQEVIYYTYQLSLLSDVYMNVVDIQLVFDITIEQISDRILHINTGHYDIDIEEFKNDGYFDLLNGTILGDATTGEILFGVKETNVDAIASTSKLMTFMIVARYIELGRISLDDVVTLSVNVENLAYSGYGTIYMDQGQQVTVRDLLGALLLKSSNEAALALAEYVAGTEEAFVDLMNEMAYLLGLDTANFVNSNGLPVYSDTLIASKKQNQMSVSDLFKLSSDVLRKYPDVIKFTSKKTMYLETLDVTVWTTNYLLYNMDNAIGLKTGTTDEAGCCLVAAATTTILGEEHILIAIVIGAESNLDRYQTPFVLLRWGMDQLAEKETAILAAENAKPEVVER